MVSSALIGWLTVQLNVELCSDWLTHSANQCWALLWLAVSQRGSMLSSALIGCFTARLNVELCSDWLFHTRLNVELCSDWLFHSAAQCWALLWLADSQRGSMLSSALIGCFTARLNVELCSDWLFHSAAQCWALLWLADSQRGSMLSSALIGCFTVRLISVAHRKETGRKIYISILSHAVISLGNYTGNKMREMLGIETAFKCRIAFYFHFRDSWSHVLRKDPNFKILSYLFSNHGNFS